MYPISPPAIYIHERVLANRDAVRRMERLLSRFDVPGEPEVVDDARLDEISEAEGWSSMGRKRTGELNRIRDPSIIFNMFRWETPETFAQLAKQFPNLWGSLLLGNNPWTLRDGRATLKTQHGVCQNAWELHSAWGCLHRCDYCNVGDFLNVMLNLEEFAERLQGLLADHPWCQLSKYDNHTDTITFEPEYGASEVLVPPFAAQRDAYLMLYTKSDNVDHLLDLDHRGNTLVCWTMSCDTVSREIEKNSPPPAARIRAAEQVQDAGYPVRFRFSPIVPVKNWREENAAMIDELLTRTRPDVITMDTFKWTEPTRLRDTMEVSLWDEEYLGYVDEYAAIEPRDRPRPILPNGKQLFPDEARATIYRFFLRHIRKHCADVPVALCGETPEMWDMLRDELRMTPNDYVCACGPTSVPGNPMLSTPT